MREFSSVDIDRLEHVHRIVKTMYDGLVNKVIGDIKSLPDNCRQSGDDSNLKDVWEEFEYQVQREASVVFGVTG